MKVRRITIEVDVPFEYDGAYVLRALSLGFGEQCEEIPYQAQVASETLSTNDRIGSVTESAP